jgi:hypothetical protein
MILIAYKIIKLKEAKIKIIYSHCLQNIMDDNLTVAINEMIVFKKLNDFSNNQ